MAINAGALNDAQLHDRKMVKLIADSEKSVRKWIFDRYAFKDVKLTVTEINFNFSGLLDWTVQALWLTVGGLYKVYVEVTYDENKHNYVIHGITAPQKGD